MKQQALRMFAATAGLALTVLAAQAQTYPARPVKVIVPFAAGGPLDIVARAVSDKLSATSCCVDRGGVESDGDAASKMSSAIEPGAESALW